MDVENMESLKSLCEDWVTKCIICHSCGKLPESLWKCGCDHLFCNACKQSLKKCDICSFPFLRRPKKNKAPFREQIYDVLIDGAKELITLLNIDVSSSKTQDPKELINNPKSSKRQRGPASPKKGSKPEISAKSPTPQKDSKVSISLDVEHEKKELKSASNDEEKPEGKFGKRKYVRKQPVTESPKTPKSKSEHLFEKVVASKEKQKDVEKLVKPTTIVAIASSDSERSAEETKETSKPIRKQQRSTDRSRSAKAIVLKEDSLSKSKKETSSEEESDEEDKEITRPRRKQQNTTKSRTTRTNLKNDSPSKSKSNQETSSEEESGDDVKEITKPIRKQQKIATKSRTTKVEVSKEVSLPRSRSKKRGAESIDSTDNTKGPKNSLSPNVKRRKANEAPSKMDESVYDFDNSDLEESKTVKPSNKKRIKGHEDVPQKEAKDTLQETKRLRSTSKSVTTVKSDSKKVRNSSPKNSIVMVATSLTKDQMNELYKFRKKFHCTMKEAYDDDVTHVICRTMEDKFTSRTIKYLHGLIGNKWILSYDWIKDSLREGELLEEEHYEVKGTCKDKEASNGAPERSRTLKTKLFKGYVAYFEGKFVPQNIPPKDDLIKLFKGGGGSVVDTTFKLNTVIKKEQKLIVIREDDQESSASTKSLVSVNVSDFLSMITEFTVNEDWVNFA